MQSLVKGKPARFYWRLSEKDFHCVSRGNIRDSLIRLGSVEESQRVSLAKKWSDGVGKFP